VNVLRAGKEIAGILGCAGSVRATKRLALTGGHPRKPGTGRFTSYQLEPHLAHLLAWSNVLRSWNSTWGGGAVVNQDARKVQISATAPGGLFATVDLALTVLSPAIIMRDPTAGLVDGPLHRPNWRLGSQERKTGAEEDERKTGFEPATLTLAKVVYPSG
jgi:hypothetical protein